MNKLKLLVGILLPILLSYLAFASMTPEGFFEPGWNLFSIPSLEIFLWNDINVTDGIETLKEIKALAETEPRLTVNTLTVICDKNYKNLRKIYAYMKNLGINPSFTLIRGAEYFTTTTNASFNPPDAGLPPLDELDDIYEQVKSFYPKDWGNKVALADLKHSIMLIRDQKKRLNCLAGNEIGVIYANGDVAVCELLNVTGNLKETDYDFYKLWHKEKFNKVREHVKTCYCSHGCFQQPNMIYDPKVMLKIATGKW